MPPVAPSERVVTTRLIDVLAAAVAVALAIVVALDLDVVGRPVLALVFVLAVPGWTVLRVIGVPFGPLTPALAFVISVAIAVATSMVAVSWLGWAWKESAIMWAGLSLMGLSSRLSFDLLTRVNRRPNAFR